MCDLIRGHMTPVLTREHGLDARKFSGTSHIFSLSYGYAAQALGLNDIRDALSEASTSPSPFPLLLGTGRDNRNASPRA